MSKIAFENISIEGVETRQPEFIVLSSKAVEGITMYPNPDWRDGRGMMLEAEENRRFVDALLSGDLGYEQTMEFHRPALIERNLITSLDPAILVFQRRDSPAP